MAAVQAKVEHDRCDMEGLFVGAAFLLWCSNRTSAEFLTDDLVLAHEFGGGAIVVYSIADDQVIRTLKCLNHPANNIAASHNTMLVAASGWGEVSVIDVASDKLVKQLQTSDALFLRASLVAFSMENRRLAVGGARRVQLWDLDSTRQPQSVLVPSYEHVPEAITFLADDTLLVASSGLRQYDRAGSVVRSFAESVTGYLACAQSADGTQIAASTAENVEVYDLSSGRKLHTFTRVSPTALAYARGEPKLAISDRSGTLTLVDSASGRPVWTTHVAGRYRLPWAVPGMALIVWCYIGYRMSRMNAAKATVTNASMGGCSPRGLLKNVWLK